MLKGNKNLILDKIGNIELKLPNGMKIIKNQAIEFQDGSDVILKIDLDDDDIELAVEKN